MKAMDKNLDIQMEEVLRSYLTSGIEDQVDYQKFYLYSIVTHSTAIEGSTVTEIENQLLFDEGIAAKGRSLTEQMMNVDLKDAYLYAFKVASETPIYSPLLLQQLSALVMRRTGSEHSTFAGQFDSSKGEFRLCNVSAGIGGRSYLAYNKVPKALDEFCKWISEEIANVNRKDVATCYRLSFEAHFRLVTIHPWVDGNGRTTRLVMNMIQRQLGLIPSIVRKEDKGGYIQSLVDSRENDDSTTNPTYLVYLAAQVFFNDNSLLSSNITVRELINLGGDVHHVFPKKYLIDNGYAKNLYNQDGNYAYLDRPVNESIGKKAPKVYFQEALEQYETKQAICGSIIDEQQLIRNLEMNCIPSDVFNMDYQDYPRFLEERRSLMAAKIRRYYESL